MKIIQTENTELIKASLKRPAQIMNIEAQVQSIIGLVQEKGDEALIELTQKYDCPTLFSLRVSEDEIITAKDKMDSKLKEAINLAYQNIYKFHASQKNSIEKIETMPGVYCWRESRAINSVGLYIPGGTAPLFSTVLMLGIPAMIASCKEIIITTPPNQDGTIHEAILYTADLIGINKIYKVGGAQAIAAMAYGTETISPVNKIFGPGNSYVTTAKQLAQKNGVAIDMPAGPSEVLIIATAESNAQYIAADLLSQAEHGTDSQVVLLTTSIELAEEVQQEIAEQIALLNRQDIAQQAIDNSTIIILNSIEECMAWSNYYAPEHLIIAGNEYEKLIPQIQSAGSVFLGNYSGESIGDYASGTNHTLPTNGYASAYSGVSLDSFTKKITFQNLTEKGLKNIGPSVEIMATAEGLNAHAQAITLRLKDIT